MATTSKSSARRRLGILASVAVLAAMVVGCTQSPEDVRAWFNDKRRPVKMREFIANPRNPLESKIEAVMVLAEHNDSPDIPGALAGVPSAGELNRIVAGVIPRFQSLIATDRRLYETRVKDAAYYLVQMEISDESREQLTGMIRDWLDGPNFFLPMQKSGRVEQRKLFELLGSESLALYGNALSSQLDLLDKALEVERAAVAAKIAEGKKVKVRSRPSDKYTANIATTLSELDSLKIPGADDMVADLFVSRIERTYPEMPSALAFPFSDNRSDRLVAVAERIITDPEYKNENLNRFKDVILNTYYRKVRQDEGRRVCTKIVAEDRTGFLRWDCLELLTSAVGRDGFVGLIQSLPDNPEALLTPVDHPTFVAQPAFTFWNSLRSYCSHLPKLFNKQVPLDVFRQLVTGGSTFNRIMSDACLATLGGEQDIELLMSQRGDKTDISGYGMQTATLGELSLYSGTLLQKRLEDSGAIKKPEVPAAAP